MKHILILLLLATFCMLLWFAEILIRDWTGLEWMNYGHLAMLIIPVLVSIWVIWINGKFVPVNVVGKYLGLSVSYIIFLAIIAFTLAKGEHGTPKMLYVSAQWGFVDYLFFSIPIILFGVITLIWCVIAARIENKKLSQRNKWFLFFSSYLIPMTSALITVLLFTQSYLFPPTPPDPIGNGLEMIHWAKSGSLLFALIAYEGIYYLWLKGKIQFRFIRAIR